MTGYSRFLKPGIISLIVLIIGIRIFLYWPTVVPGSGSIDRLEFRRNDVSVKLKKGVATNEIANTKVFDGFTPNYSSTDIEERLGQSDNWVSERGASYNEYVRPNGRLRFYSEFIRGGEREQSYEARWIELIPNQLLVDKFLNKDIAKHLDLSRATQVVYIRNETDGTYLTTYLGGNRVVKIFWSTWPQ